MPARHLTADRLPARAAANFFTHSGHVPLVILILEALVARPGYFLEPDPYVLLGAGVLQALLCAWLELRGLRAALAANLAGPLLYTVVEMALEGPGFFNQTQHLAYWIYGAGFGLLQAVQERRPAVPLLVLLENVLRASIPLAMYFLFEARTKPASYQELAAFFADPAHVFLAIVLPLLGVLLGFADLSLRRSMLRIAELTARLRRYSEWSMGAGIVARAIENENVLALQRVERAVLFADIRGFTAWSEAETPERVVGLLNAVYQAAEEALAPFAPIKLKFTADEAMAVFAEAGQATAAGLALLHATAPLLREAGLGIGAGVHAGPMIEGVLGSQHTRAFDVIGDTVNSAQRLCSAAAAGELLVSAPACVAAQREPRVWRDVLAKGKREPLRAGVLGVDG